MRAMCWRALVHCVNVALHTIIGARLQFTGSCRLLLRLFVHTCVSCYYLRWCRQIFSGGPQGAEVLSVSATPGTGRQQDIKITGASTLNEDEVQRMVQQAEQFAEADKKQREAVDVRNQVR